METASEIIPDIETKKVADLKAILLEKASADSVGTMQKIHEFYSKLKKEYGEEEIRKYRLFHALIGSTVTDEQSPKFDLPGNQIEEFITKGL